VDRRAGPGRQGSRHHDRVGVGDGTGGLRPVSFSDGAWSARESNGGEEESAECAVVGRRLPLLGASGKNFPAISRARHAGRGTLARRLVSSAVPGGVGHIYVIYEISVVGLVTEQKGRLQKWSLSLVGHTVVFPREEWNTLQCFILGTKWGWRAPSNSNYFVDNNIELEEIIVMMDNMITALPADMFKFNTKFWKSLDG
jgi:hypothetical protein